MESRWDSRDGTAQRYHQCAELDAMNDRYALLARQNPLGMTVHPLQSQLPFEMKGKLPTAEQLADVVRVEIRDVS